MRLPRIEPEAQSGDEPFRAGEETLGFKLQDYWRWSGSDLMNNAARGVMAEYLVAKALGVTQDPREEWGEFDVEAPGCGTIEVKSSAYIQSWEQQDYSKISFDIAKRKSAWNPKTGKYRELDPPERIADVYVFCLLEATSVKRPSIRSTSGNGISSSCRGRSSTIATGKDSKSIGLNSLLRLSKEAISVRRTQR